MGLRISRTTAVLLCFMLTYITAALSAHADEYHLDAPIYLAVTSSTAVVGILLRDHRRGHAAPEADLQRLDGGRRDHRDARHPRLFPRLPRSAIFTRYDRAMGAFQTQYVFGPSSFAPRSTCCMHPHGKAVHLQSAAFCLMVLAFGVLCPSSRAAWAMFCSPR